MYPEQLVAPMRTDLTSAGFKELKTPEAVDSELKDQNGTTLLVINSVCGCAAGAARPGIKWALQNASKKPESLATVKDHFAAAGADIDELDGLTVGYEDWWFNLRGSNTQPLLRLNVEADDKATLESHTADVLKLIRG